MRKPTTTLVIAFLTALPLPAGNVGTNLDAVADFSSQYVFVDAFKQSRDWITQTATVFDTNEAALLDLDADGWVKSLPAPGPGHQFDRVASLLFFAGEDARYPAGRYIVTFEGEGVLEYRFDAVKNGGLSGPGRDVLDVTPQGGFAMVIRSTNPANYLRNIRVWMPGFDEVTGPGAVFHPDFLALLQSSSTLRFMDWMHTNNSPQEAFADRPKTTDARYTLAGKGVPLEIMIELANRLDQDPWFPMPHRASDDYVIQFATMVRNLLGSSSKVYVEYSNEVWNSGFPQGAFIESQGQANFPGGPESGFTKRMNQHGRRTAEICDLWRAVFSGAANRVVCVLGAQAANTFTATEALDCPLWSGAPCSAHHIGALAIAPYFGGYLGGPATAATVATLTVDQVFSEITTGGTLAGGPAGGAIAQTVGWVADNRAVANARQLALIAYEGGQHLVGFFGAENNTGLTSLLIAANRDPRMGAAYTKYLEDSWEAAGGELFVHFNSCGRYSKFGSWGAVERLDQPSTPKQNALVAFAGEGPCLPDANILCLNGGRFRVRASWRTADANGTAQARDIGLADTGLFTFFAPDNVELLVKVLNACSPFGRYWVFLSAATNQEWHVTVDDTATGSSKTYDSTLGTFPPLRADTDAFATCP
jgi:hypothetical protein